MEKAIQAAEQELGTEKCDKYKYLWKQKISTPLSSDYRPEIDPMNELDKQTQNYYQGLIGVL